MQVRAERRRLIRPVAVVAAGVLLGVRGPRAGAVRGARRVRQPPAVPAPPGRCGARVRVRDAGPARAARLRRRRLPRRAVADGARRRRRRRRPPASRRLCLLADMRSAQRQQGPRGRVQDAKPAVVVADSWQEEVSERACTKKRLIDRAFMN